MVYKILYLIFYIAFACGVEFGSEIFKESCGARNAALGGVSLDLNGGSNPVMLVKPINSYFDFSHMNKFGGLYKLNSISYFNINNKSNPIFINILNRIVEDIPDTRDAWLDNGDSFLDQEEINYFNIKNFSQNEIGLKISVLKKINKLVIASSFKPSYTSISEFSAWGISLDVSVLKQFYNEKIDISLRIEDILSLKKWSTKSYEYTIPQIVFGGNLNFNKSLFSFEIGRNLNEDSKLNYNTGLELYQSNEVLVLRCGTSSNNLFTLGTGFNLNSFKLDYAFIYHAKDRPFEPSQILSITLDIGKINWIKSKLDP